MNEHNNIKKVDITATLECLTTLLFWSLGPIFITYLAGHIDSFTQNFLRYLVSCIFWFPFLIFSIRNNRFDKGIWLKAIFPAVANLTMQSLYASAFYYVSPAFMILLLKSSIVWIALFSLVFFIDERPLAKSKRFWLGMIFSVAGVTGVMYYKEDFAAAKTITGIFLTLGAGLAFAIYAISARIVFKKNDSRQAFSVISIYTTAGFAVLAFMFGNVKECLQIGLWQWSCILISAITAIALGHTLYYAAMKRIGVTIPALLILAQPFVVLAFSYFIFKESLNSLQLISGLILIAGSALAIWAQEHVRRSE